MPRARIEPMSSVTIYAPRTPSTDAAAGARLHAAFLAGRSAHTLRAYTADLAAFSAYLGEPGPGAHLSRLIGLPAGEGNGVLLAYRAHMIDANNGDVRTVQLHARHRRPCAMTIMTITVRTLPAAWRPALRTCSKR